MVAAKFTVWLFLCVFALPLTAIAVPGNPGAQTAPGTYIWIGDHRLHIHCLGEGSPTVVFDSGLGDSTLVWSLVQPGVAEFTRACVYDRAGYGWSDRGPRPRDSSRIVSELERLLGHAGVGSPYVLVGHSFGGINVRMYATRHPQRIAGIVLVDSSHEDQFDRFERAGLPATVPKGPRFVVSNRYQIPDALPDELKPLAQTFAIGADSTAALYSELRNMRTSAKQLRSHRHMPNVPLVVISRNLSGAVQPRGLEEVWMSLQADLAGRSKQGSLIVARTDEHYIQLHEPQLVIDAIEKVVETNRITSGCAKMAPC